MNWNNILTVYLKELRDMLRDRRTLISMLVVPTLVMPGILVVIGVVMSKVQRDVAATTPTVMMLGGDDSPLVRAALGAHTAIKIVPPADDWKTRISDKKLGAAIQIPAGFDATVERNEAATVTIYK